MRDDWVQGWGADLVPDWADAAGGDGDGDAAFDNSGHVPGAGSLLDALAARSAALRAEHGARARLGLAYGAHPRERLDLLLPEGVPEGLLVFVHGGYWMMSGRAAWTVMATGALAHGSAVAIPSYPLTPEVPISRITQAIAAAVAFAAAQVSGPIRVIGHSAGGHLAARMACAPGPLPKMVADRLVGVATISGLHDLRPFLQARKMNETLHLDAAQAGDESPALMRPRPDLPIGIRVGARERPELVRQARLLHRAWDADTTLEIVPGEDHFSIAQGLIDPKNAFVAGFMGKMYN